MYINIITEMNIHFISPDIISGDSGKYISFVNDPWAKHGGQMTSEITGLKRCLIALAVISLIAPTGFAQIGNIRTFTVPSYEMFPREPYEITARLVRISEHCDLYVAEDQLAPYVKNNNLVPVLDAELDSLLDFIENSTLVNPAQGAFLSVRNLVASGNEAQVPERCEILMLDILDEAGLGRFGSKEDYYFGGIYEPEGPDGSELLMLDTHPQRFIEDEEVWYIDAYGNMEPWTGESNTGKNAVVNLLAHWMAYQVNPDEEGWVVDGVASMCEQRTVGLPSFYGDYQVASGLLNVSIGGYNLTYTPSISWLLTNRMGLLKSYLFFEYLHEKYGGDNLLKAIGAASENGIEGMSAGLTQSRETNPLTEPFQSRTLEQIFLDYGVACVVDTTDDNDNGLYQFDNLTFERTSRVGTTLEWSWSRKPPYLISAGRWTVQYAYTFYAMYHPNALLDPLGKIYFDGKNNLKLGIDVVRVAGEGDYSSEFRIDQVVLDAENRGEIELSPTGWLFGPQDSAYYSNLLIVTVKTDSIDDISPAFIVNNEPDYFLAPRVNAIGASETSIRLYINAPVWESAPGGSTIGESTVASEENKRDRLTKWKQSSGYPDRSTANEGGLIGYAIHRSENAESGYTEIATGAIGDTYLDDGLVSDQTYHYRVYADYASPPGRSEFAYDSAAARSVSNIVTCVSNFGMYGDPNDNFPSFEWPNGTGVWYLWMGGFWAGTEIEGLPLVTQADYSLGYEWIPTLDSRQQISVLGSEQFVHHTKFDDKGPIAGHIPIGLLVDQTVQLWPASEDSLLANVMMIQVDVVNISGGNLEDVYLAWYFDCDVGQGPNGDVSSPYIDDYLDFDESRRMAYMYDADDPTTSEDDTGENGLAPGYIGARFINTPVWNARPYFSWWNWENDPGNDEESFAFMNGSHEMFNGQHYMPTPGEVNAPPFDYRFLMSTGPYSFADGETLSVDIALMIGDGLENLQAVSDHVISEFMGVISGETELPSTFTLKPAYPNPFNPATVIRVSLPEASELKLRVYNILGARVAELASGRYSAGHHSFVFDGKDLASGVYFVRALAPGKMNQTRKVVLIR